MRIKLIVSAAAIALVAGAGSASAGEKFATLDGISAFESLAGIQAIPLDTAEMASVTAMLYFQYNAKKDEFRPLFNGHTTHYTHSHPGHGIKYTGGGGLVDIGVDSGTDALHLEAHIECGSLCGVFTAP